VSSLPPEVANLSTNLDLDLDVDLDTPTKPGDQLQSVAEMTQPLMTGAEFQGDQTLEFNLPAETGSGDLDFELPVTTEAHPRPAAPPSSDFGGLDFDLDPPTAKSEPAPSSEFGDFQLSKSPDDAPPISEYGSLTDDPLARKLELAEEFRQIGDLEGARDLLEEVIAKADGGLKSKAQGMLDRLA
jgi:pilus assembly protein FimV